MPIPARLMSPQAVRHFLQENMDFRQAPLFGCFLSCPYVVATATYDRGYILDHVLPNAHNIPEGPIWGMRHTDSTIVLARNNRAATLFVEDDG